MTLTLARLKDNLDDLSPAQRSCLMFCGMVSAVVMFPFMLVFNLIYLIATKVWVATQPNLPHATGCELDLDLARGRRGSVDSGDSVISAPPSYRSGGASSVFEYPMPTSSSSPEARQIRRAKLYIDGSLRSSPTSSYSNSPPPPATIFASTSDYAVYYSPPPTSSRSTSRTFGPIRRLLPSFHRRTASDPTAMSIMSSQSAPSSLSSVSSHSHSPSGGSPSRTHRRAFSQASADSTGTDGRPVNALPGEVFSQRYEPPFSFKRVSSPVDRQPVSPKTRPFSPDLSPCDEGRPRVRRRQSRVGRQRGRSTTSGTDVGEGKQRFGGLRALGRKIRRRVVSRRRDVAEMDSCGTGSY
ncbi:uncharacterized protein B0H18DRAFT_175725 [Fomitopsis serialis]|uniref:uncharacterized protein n=1 Tax=Fomitopsis serialis TaxID=139415 RepID=UPI002007A7F1|nr:uncharacterized protein B0H18DRAFT_175725 [Neoantrodia serialis]KAH9929820.1 hypothetical protein B0H18DRAFT_175725 [Neoantrodia serialis]